MSSLFHSLLYLHHAIAKKSKSEAKAIPVNENVVTPTDAQIKNVGIQTGKAVAGKMSSILKVSGLVEVPPENTMSISFPLADI
jgi:cobalt-zinc-cadmium efflux system membrane fusion protein